MGIVAMGLMFLFIALFFVSWGLYTGFQEIKALLHNAKSLGEQEADKAHTRNRARARTGVSTDAAVGDEMQRRANLKQRSDNTMPSTSPELDSECDALAEQMVAEG